MTPILITGANGFIGRSLLTRLQNRNVRAAIRHPDRCPTQIPSIDYHILGNIHAHTDWSAALHQIKTVIHLAARVHVLHETAKDPLAAFRRVNVEGTERLLQQAITAGIQRFIYISTLKVNGETTPDRPFSETDPPHPQDAYAHSKWEAEQLIKTHCEAAGIEWVIVRPPLVYGREAGGNFARLLQWIERGFPLPFASIQNQRSLLNIDNLVDFLIQCIDHPAAARQLFLVADAQTISTPGLVRQLADAMGRSARLFAVPPSCLHFLATCARRQDLLDRLCGSLCVNIDKAQQLLNWSPPVTLTAGLCASVQPRRVKRD